MVPQARLEVQVNMVLAQVSFPLYPRKTVAVVAEPYLACPCSGLWSFGFLSVCLGLWPGPWGVIRDAQHCRIKQPYPGL